MIRVETLGRTRVFVQGSELTSLTRQPIRCGLLIYLAVERKVTREKLLNIFWADSTDADARHTLNQGIFELRKLLGGEAILTRGSELHVAASVHVDLHVFNEAVERGDLRIALENYHGSFLHAGPAVNGRGFQEWVDQRALKARRAWVRAAHKYTTELYAGGNIDTAIQVARRATEYEPQEDELQHQLIELLANSGRRREAIAQYELYKNTLRGDGLEPLDETKQLIAAVRAASTGNLPSTANGQSVQNGRLSHEESMPVTETVEDVYVKRPAWKERLGAITSPRMAIATYAVLFTLAGWLVAREWLYRHRLSQPIVVETLPVLAPADNPELKQLGQALNGTLPGSLNKLRHASVRTMRLVEEKSSSTREPQPDLQMRVSLSRSDAQLNVHVQLLDARNKIVLDDDNTLHSALPLDSESVETLMREAGRKARRIVGDEVRLRWLHKEARNPDAFASYLHADSLRHNAFGPANTALYRGALRNLELADSSASEAARKDRRWPEPHVLRAHIDHARSIVAANLQDSSMRRTWLESSIAHASVANAKRRDDPDILAKRGELRYLLWFVRMSLGDPAEDVAAAAVDDLEKALRFDPQRSDAYVLLAKIRHDDADFKKELYALEAAQDVDLDGSQQHNLLYNLAIVSYELRADKSAQRLCEEGRGRFPADFKFLVCEAMLFAWADSIRPDTVRVLEIVRTIDRWPRAGNEHLPNEFRLWAANVFQRMGNNQRAQALIDEVKNSGSYDDRFLRLEAAARTLAGEKKIAVKLLQRYAKALGPTSGANLRSRVFEPLRSEPAFDALLKLYPPALQNR
jgi:DNA-binding SARP family transcriptional activator